MGVRRRAAWALAGTTAVLLAAVLGEVVPRSPVEAVPVATAVPPEAPTPTSTSTSTPRAEPPAPAPPEPTERPSYRRTVYLTFDDGPDPRWTPQVLEILRRHDVHAVFFQVGTNAEAHPDLVQRVRRAGHLVGNHTWSHPRLTTVPARRVRAQLDRTEQALGERSRCVRPPYGAHDPRVDRIVRARGQRIVLWDVDPQDWARPASRRIVRRVLDQVRPGARILLHDGGGDRRATVAALERVIVRLQARGYRFGLLDC